MFSKFIFTPDASFVNNIKGSISSGSCLYNKQQKEMEDSLSNYVLKDGTIDGSELKKNWFSISEKDIFISHSHKDLDEVKAFAGWLYDTFKLTSFIDSCCWGHCDKLLKQIDNHYCRNSENIYSYETRNRTTSHVHMMLSTALSEMMDKSECVIFFKTPNSIKVVDEITDKSGNKTESPWIYHELFMSSILPPKLNRLQPVSLTESINKMRDSLPVIRYDVSSYLNDLTLLTEDDLLRWEMLIKHHPKRFSHKLDYLYSVKKNQ